MPNTTERNLPYPDGTGKVGQADAYIKDLAEAVDALPYVKSGQDSVPGLATGTVATKRVNFASAYPVGVVPNVIAQVRGSSAPQNFDCGVSAEDNAGFTVNVTRRAGATTTAPIVYIAHG